MIVHTSNTGRDLGSGQICVDFLRHLAREQKGLPPEVVEPIERIEVALLDFVFRRERYRQGLPIVPEATR